MNRSLLLAFVCVAIPGLAQADDLPGVKPAEPLVQPMPEPEDGVRDPNSGHVRVGDWDVKVSGFVRYEIGAGKDVRIAPPKK